MPRNLTDITLIFPPSPFLIDPAVFPPLGILYLSAYLKKIGFSVKCVDAGLKGYFDSSTVKSLYAGISITTPQRFEAYDIIKSLKDEGHIILAGGPHATHMPEECREAGCDYVFQGEAETSLANFLLEETHKSWLVPENKLLDLDTQMPFPDRFSIPITKYKYSIDGESAAVMMSSRGCPYNCTFCARITKQCRIQSAVRTFKEIMFVHDTLGYNAFMFFDDVFTSSKKRLRELCNYLEGQKFKFRCFSRTNLIDPEICGYLKDMGVVEVGLGVESGSKEILMRNLKGTTPEINTRAIELLHRFGIRAKSFLIVGLPGETKETVIETCKWIETAKPDDIDVSILQPYPGSDLFKYPEKFGLQFEYNNNVTCYKGIPGQYKCGVRTEKLSSEELLYYRDFIEENYKSKELLK